MKRVFTQEKRLFAAFLLLALSVASPYFASAQGLCVAPETPTNLVASALSRSSIGVTWLDNSTREDGFRLYRRPQNSTSDWLLVATLAANSTQYNDGGLSEATTYCYLVRAFNQWGQSETSNEGCATTLQNTIPSSPGSLTTTQVCGGNNGIRLNWNDNSGNEIGFIIERSNSALGPWTELFTKAANETAGLDVNVKTGIRYCYRVRAFNEKGNSGVTNTLCDSVKAPTKPVSVDAVALGISDINVTWSNSDREDGYYVERTNEASVPFAQIAQTAANTTAYSDKDLKDNVKHCYRIVSFNCFGTTYSDTACAATFAALPIAFPINLTANPVDFTTVDLTWVDRANNEDGYRIEKRNDNGVFELINQTDRNAQGFRVTGLVDGKTHCFRVIAFNVKGNSDYSNTACGTTPILNVPNTPTNLKTDSILVGSPRIRVTWQDNSNSETSFVLQRDENGNGNYAQIAVLNPNTTIYSDNAVSRGVLYCYRVYALNQKGNSAFSNVDCNTVPQPAVPNTPTDFLSTPNNANQRIQLTWRDNSSSEDNYVVERDETGSGSNFKELAIIGANSVYFEDYNINAGKFYCYRVSARNISGKSAYSNMDCDSISRPQKPNTPSQLDASTTINERRIKITWKDNSTNESRFVIERDENNGTGSFVYMNEVSPNTTAYFDYNITPGKLYCYRVYAVNNGGNSNYSNADCDSVRTPLPPASPSNLNADTAIGSQYVVVSWKDNSSNEARFIVEKESAQSGIFFYLATVNANDTVYNDYSISGGTQYCYRVFAENEGGRSANSNIDCVTPRNLQCLPEPTAFAAVDGESAITLSWNDNSTTEESFHIERSTQGGQYAEIAVLGANATNFSDTSAINGNYYCYRVRGKNGNCYSKYSNIACAYRRCTAASGIARPTSLSTVPYADHKIWLRWFDNSYDETSYVVERSINSGTPSYTTLVVLPANSESYMDESVTNGISYIYRIQAVNAQFFSQYSNTSFATAYAQAAFPAQPTDLNVTSVDGFIVNIGWVDNSNNEFGFRIEWAYASSPFVWYYAGQTGANQTTFTKSITQPNGRYIFRVYAYNDIGNSNYSDTYILDVEPSPNAASAPTNLKVFSKKSPGLQANLYWNDNSNSEAGFYIDRSVDSSGIWKNIDFVRRNVFEYADTTVEIGHRYYYRVYAFNNFGYSGFSNTAYVDLFNVTTVNELKNVDFNIYPNPNNGVFKVDMNVPSAQVVVYNVTGTVVHTATLKQGSNGVDLSTLAKGFYMVKLSTKDAYSVKRLVIQ